MNQVKCVSTWVYQPLLNLDEVYIVIDEFFANGESNYILENMNSEHFEVPCIFLEENNVM